MILLNCMEKGAEETIELKFEQFPNGETRICEIGDIIKYTNVILKYESDEDLFKLMLFKRTYDDFYPEQQKDGRIDKKIDLIIAYMPYSRQDRVKTSKITYTFGDKKGKIGYRYKTSDNFKDYGFTLKYVTDFINSLNFDRIYVFEPHSDVCIALLNRVTPVNMTELLFSKEFCHDLNACVMFPDASAQKRYSKMPLYDNRKLVGFKHRDFDTGKIKSLEILGDCTNFKIAYILDDLCSYGGTFIKAAEALKEKGIEEINLIVAHCEDSIFKGKLLESGLINKVITTNSILSQLDNGENAKYKDMFKVYDIKDIIAKEEHVLDYNYKRREN